VADIIGCRHIALHEYFAIDWGIVWMTATQDAPLFREQMAAILEKKFSDK
jgi:uncharacterized protein with HEPN domain